MQGPPSTSKCPLIESVPSAADEQSKKKKKTTSMDYCIGVESSLRHNELFSYIQYSII